MRFDIIFYVILNFFYLLVNEFLSAFVITIRININLIIILKILFLIINHIFFILVQGFPNLFRNILIDISLKLLIMRKLNFIWFDLLTFAKTKILRHIFIIQILVNLQNIIYLLVDASFNFKFDFIYFFYHIFDIFTLLVTKYFYLFAVLIFYGLIHQAILSWYYNI